MERALPVPPRHPHPHPLRLVYLGSPALAVAPLRALVAAGHDVALVVSRPDRRRGRGAGLSPSPVKAAALELGLAVSDDVNATAEVGADLAVVVAYGRLIKRDLLERVPFVNLHFSLLPRWRGAAPVERALLAGDTVTGVCVMAIEEGLDTGGVYRRAEVPILEQDTVESLRGRLVETGTELLLDCLRHGFGPAVAQQGEAVYAAKIDPAELELDWTAPARHVVRTVALGRAWTTWHGGRLLVHEAVVADAVATDAAVADAVAVDAVTTDPGRPTDAPPPAGTVRVVDGRVLVRAGDGDVELRTVQPEGRARQRAADWRNGARLTPGERLGALGTA